MRSSANAPQTEKMETDGVSEELLKTIGKLIIPVVIISLGGYLFVRKKKQPYT
jgi:purine-cytosine permease-like protein